MRLTKHQQKLIDGVPLSYKQIFVRAYTQKSKAAGIKAFCLHCVGYLRNEVRDCTSYGCPLWEHRPYKSGGLEEETEGS